MNQPKSDVLQGTFDLMVLKTLDTLGSMHGYGIAQRIQQVSEPHPSAEPGHAVPALLRLEQKGWISAKWGVSDNNRRAKFYSLTRAGSSSSSARRRTGTASSRSWAGCSDPGAS